MNFPDVERLRMRREDRPRRQSVKPPRHKTGDWFLKGPIPGTWLRVVMAQHSLQGVRAALVLWYLAGLEKSREVTPTWATWQRFGVTRDAGRRGLAVLERARLVTVKRQRGRCPVVTLLDVQE